MNTLEGAMRLLSRRRVERVVLPAAIACLAILAWRFRWDQDDAFISYRYARNWIQGFGIVWNPGEPPVEGYSNFLWVAVLAGLGHLGLPLTTASYLASIGCFIASLIATYTLARTVLKNHLLALLVCLLVGTNYSFFSYATGGLETQLAAFLTLLLLNVGARVTILRRTSLGLLMATSLIAACSVMTRPDGALPVSVLGVWIAVVLFNSKSSWHGWAVEVLALTTPGVIVLARWVGWKMQFYGDWLPNTYYVKLGATHPQTLVRGALYVGLFFASYWLIPILLVLAYQGLKKLRKDPGSNVWLSPTLMMTVLVCVTLAYIVVTGGDIMEFRFIVPIIPPMLVLVVTWLSELVPRHVLLASGILALGSISHGLFFQYYMAPPGIGTIRRLEHYATRASTTSWSSVGMVLGRDLPADSTVKIAVSAAGAIPYYSHLRSVDIIGLNDKWIALHGRLRQLCVVCTGHHRLGDIPYLRSAGTTLIVGDPQIETQTEFRGADLTHVLKAMFYQEEMSFQDIPTGARMLMVPLDATHALFAVYLTPHPDVERALADGRWFARPLFPPS